MMEFPNVEKKRYALLRLVAQLVDLRLTLRPDLEPKSSFPRSLN